MTSVRMGDGPVPRRHDGRPYRRLTAICVFIGLPLGAAGLSVSWLLSDVDASSRAEHAEETARAIIHQLDRRSSAASKPVDETALFLGSASASLAQAELQTVITSRVEAAKGRIAQVQPLDRTEQDPPGRVGAEFTFDIDNAGLLDLLHAIEAGLPILTVPRLDIHVEAASDAPGSPGDLLRVSMTVEGAWRAAPP